MTDHNATGATAWPWEIYHDGYCIRNDSVHIASCETREDAAFIVEAVNAYEPLKARLAEVERERDEAKKRFAKTWARALAAVALAAEQKEAGK